MAPLTDEPVRSVQCPRCGVWCLLGTVDGFKTAVTATPLTLDGYRAALLAGLRVYRLGGFKTRSAPVGKLRRVRVDDPAGISRLLEHPCGSWANTTLKAPQKAAQGRVPCSALCTGSCQACDPPPFELDWARLSAAAEEVVAQTLFTNLGAVVIEVIEHESLA